MSLITLRLSILLLAVALLQVTRPALAFELLFPSEAKDTYWVTNQTNALIWSSVADDPSYFSVELLNANASSLAGNFQIANALLSENGTAPIFLDFIPYGTYTVLFVNSSNYAMDKPQVYYTSPSFEIKPNGTIAAQYTSKPGISTNSTHSTHTISSVSALTGVSPTRVGTTDAKNGSHGGATRMPYTFTTLLLSLVLTLSAAVCIW